VNLICDFCAEPNPPWEYMARSIDTVEGEVESIGSWCACNTCAHLIDSDRRDDLARRAYERLPILPLSTYREIQAKFFLAKTSGARPIKVTPIHGKVFESWRHD
jgi:hypothetical protein